MQAWYWDYPKTCNGANWANTLTGQASDMGSAGFTHIWLPPLSRASFGSCSNGYDPKDLYDLGEFGQGPTGFGSRADLNNLLNAFNTNGLDAVVDVVYNHRDGGDPEDNPAVGAYITTHYNASKNPFPSDRFRCVLPLGGASGNGAGDYYLKISSKTGSSRFDGKAYVVYTATSLVGWQGLPDQTESEPNGGGDCSEAFDDIQLGVNTNAFIDPGSSCRTDEFKLTVNAGDFNPAGDELEIYLTNPNGDYADHRVYGIWSTSANADVVGQMKYQTYTDFTTLPSGQGAMNFENFRPNSTNASSTSLDGDWDWLWFFYDYDQNQVDTKNKLFDWSTWLYGNVGMRGFRMDAVKHFNPSFIGELMNHLNGQGINPGLVVGEYFDGNAFLLKNWVDEVQSAMNPSALSSINMRVFDFALRNALKAACDQFGYDARQVFNSGVVDGVGGSGFNTVTFVNNHDFRGPNEPLQNDPMLAYAYILTNNRVGLPSVFYPDYYGVTIPNAPTQTLKSQIDALMEVHQQHIFGAPNVDYLSRINTPYTGNYTGGFPNTSLIYQISGGASGREVIVAINFAGEPLQVEHGINTSVLGPGDVLEDVIGNSVAATVTVSNNNTIDIQLPPRSYTVFVEGQAPLPVELLDFRAIAAAEAVQLSWQVAHEEALEGYELQRALDGQHFRTLHWQAAQGLNLASFSYGYKDEQVKPGQALYYRLRMLDMDGSEDYSPVRVVQLAGKDASVRVQPNPVRERSWLEWQSVGAGEARIAVYNLLGELILEYQLNINRGEQRFELDLSGQPDGLYLIRLDSDDTNWSGELLKH